jgi:CheY-like chemotaxis protein
MKKINSVCLIDDDAAVNFMNQRILRLSQSVDNIVVMESASHALEHLRENSEVQPDLILLDINMPGMDGWEFLNEYSRILDRATSRPVIVMLTSSMNPMDITHARKFQLVSDFKTKPLTLETIQAILRQHF